MFTKPSSRHPALNKWKNCITWKVTKKALGPQQEANVLTGGAAIERYTPCRQERFETTPDLCAGWQQIQCFLQPQNLHRSALLWPVYLEEVNKPPQMWSQHVLYPSLSQIIKILLHLTKSTSSVCGIFEKRLLLWYIDYLSCEKTLHSCSLSPQSIWPSTQGKSCWRPDIILYNPLFTMLISTQPINKFTPHVVLLCLLS